jgi:hypothetical protein
MTYAEREAESRHGAEATDDARRRTAQRDETGGVPAPRDSIDEELREGSPVTRNIRSSSQYKPKRTRRNSAGIANPAKARLLPIGPRPGASHRPFVRPSSGSCRPAAT